MGIKMKTSELIGMLIASMVKHGDRRIQFKSTYDDIPHYNYVESIEDDQNKDDHIFINLY